MSGIGEGIAEFGQGAMASRAVEPAAGETGRADGDGHTHESACLNCGTVLVGSHCHACGQAAHVHRTLGAFWHDLLHGVFHFEGKTWRTLPLLLWQPGKLTREYIDGRRASYVSPIALFLFFVFCMFAVFHAVADHEAPEGVKVDGNAVTVNGNFDQAIERLDGQIAGLQQQKAAAKAQGKDTDAIDEKIDSTRDALSTVKDMKSAGNEMSAKALGDSTSSIPQIDKALKKFRANPELAAYKLQTYAYKYSWLLIPISVPFMWLLFPFSRRFHLYDHTVFVTYSLCFMTLLVIVSMLAGAVGLGWLAGVLFFVPPFHIYRQLAGTYDLPFRKAFWRTNVLLVFCSLALLIFLLAIMAQTA